jgi:hypothetical protein
LSGSQAWKARGPFGFVAGSLHGQFSTSVAAVAPIGDFVGDRERA